MTSRFKLAALLSALALLQTLSFHVYANDILPAQVASKGFYLSAGYTMVYAPDDRVDVVRDPSTQPVDSSMFLDYDLGFRAASLALGYQFDSGLRAEFEASYRRNELEVIEFSDERDVLNTGANDAVDAFSGFANVYYEFASPRLPVQPYVGVGAGYTSVGYKGNFSVLDGFTRTDEPLFDDRSDAFAWQLMVGASMAFTRRTRLSAEYRYWRSGNLNFSSDPAAEQSEYSTRHELHMAGIALQFFPGQQSTDIYSSRSKTRHKTANPDPDPNPNPNPNKWYVAGYFGVAAAEDSDVDDNSLDTNFDAFDIGPAGGISVGYQWRSRRGRVLRAELEASAFSNEADLVDFSFILGEFRLQGDARTRAIAVNFIAERSRRFRLSPYAGIGFGYAEVDYDVEGTEPLPGFADRDFLKDSAGSPTAQALLGLRVGITPRLSMNLGYKYWWAPLLKLRNPRGERIETEHSAHMIQLGAHWRMSGNQR